MKKIYTLSALTFLGVLTSLFIATQAPSTAHAAGWTFAGSVNTQVNSTATATSSVYLCKVAVPKQGYKVKARAVVTTSYGTGPIKAMTANAAGVSYGNVINSNVGQTSITGYGPNIVSASAAVSGGVTSTTNAGWVKYAPSITVSSIVFC
jgi:hypothetical protein